jgi:hypothetical protein
MLPSLYGPKIFRASPEKDFFDSIDPTRTFTLGMVVVCNADKAAVGAKFRRSGLIAIAAVEAMS